MTNIVYAADAINCKWQQLANGQCSFDVNKLLGKESSADATVTVIAQDIMLAATFIIPTVVMIGLMYSGWIYITAKDDSTASKGKNGIKRSFIWLVLVMSAYAIIRLVQYIAKG